MRRFVLLRKDDMTGLSGVGVVVWGLEFPDRRCAYRWHSGVSTTTLADSIEDVVALHGHGGRTRLEWMDSELDSRLWRLLQAEFEAAQAMPEKAPVVIRPDSPVEEGPDVSVVR